MQTCQASEPVIVYGFLEPPPVFQITELECITGTDFELTGHLIDAKLNCDAMVEVMGNFITIYTAWRTNEIENQKRLNDGIE